MSTPTHTKLYFKKTITILVEESYSFKDFKEYDITRLFNEREEDYNARAVAVWNELCKNADKKGNIECEDEERECAYEDIDENCEDEREEMIKEAFEKIENPYDETHNPISKRLGCCSCKVCKR
jgi:hypothetical protein